MIDYTGTGQKDPHHPKYNKTNLIALIGPKGCGKTTLSNQLKDFGWKTTSFATPIKNMIAELLYIQNVNERTVVRMLYGDLKETPTKYLGNKSPRHAMQTLGTEWRETIYRNLWLDIWERSINLNKEKIIIDDCRFIHEAEKIKNLGGKLIRITRPQILNLDPHPSEQEQNKIVSDLEIINAYEPVSMLFQLKTHLGENL